jgi:hypothetical protein
MEVHALGELITTDIFKLRDWFQFTIAWCENIGYQVVMQLSMNQWHSLLIPLCYFSTLMVHGSLNLEWHN